jgi:hypothetical protein
MAADDLLVVAEDMRVSRWETAFVFKGPDAKEGSKEMLGKPLCATIVCGDQRRFSAAY